MVNPIETAFIQAIVETEPTIARPDGGTIKSLGERPVTIEDGQRSPGHGQYGDKAHDLSLRPDLGIVTPHNAQRGLGALGKFVDDDVAEHASVPVRVYPSAIDGGAP